MVFDTSALCRAAKKQYKQGGYTVALSGGGLHEMQELILACSSWTAIVRLEDAPGKLLALIVEQLQQLPENGMAYRVSKGMPPQKILMETVESAIQSFGSEPEKMQTAHRTPICYGDKILWQSEEYSILLAEDLDNIFEFPNRAKMQENEFLMADDEKSRLYIRVEKLKVYEEMALEALTRNRWFIDE